PLLAGDEFPERRTEKDDGAGDVLDITHMPEDVADQSLPLLRRDRVMAQSFGLDRSRSDAVEADGAFRPFSGHPLRPGAAAAGRCGMYEAAETGPDAGGQEDRRAAIGQHEMVGGRPCHLP